MRARGEGRGARGKGREGRGSLTLTLTLARTTRRPASTSLPRCSSLVSTTSTRPSGRASEPNHTLPSATWSMFRWGLAGGWMVVGWWGGGVMG